MPDIVASELIAAQESQLRRLREYAYQLAAARRASFGARGPTELVEVIEGAVNVRQAFVRLQRDAQHEIRVFDKPPYTAEQPDGNPEEYRLLGEGQVRYRTLYERAALAQPERMAEVWNGIRQGERARVARSLPMKMALSDKRLALIPVSTYSDNAGEAAYLVPCSTPSQSCSRPCGTRPCRSIRSPRPRTRSRSSQNGTRTCSACWRLAPPTKPSPGPSAGAYGRCGATSSGS